MITRISALIKKYGLSPSEFADRIELQRPNVSHVLSGRNKPSLDFITRIIHAFPEVNPEWLITGNGKTLRSLEQKQEPVTESQNTLPSPASSVQQTRKAGTIQKIIFFFEDGSFQEYTPK